MTTLFLLAHQDDEIGVFHEIKSTLDRGDEVQCIYLTNGSSTDATSQRRNQESRIVLCKIGNQEKNIFFLGSELGINDGCLVEHLESSWKRLVRYVAGIATVERIIMHAWEGGHHDHDACHLLGLALAKHLNVLEDSRQFPLYRMPANRFSLTFAAPLAENGATQEQHIPLAARIKYLALLRHYRSQRRVIAKLAPHMAWDYLWSGTQKLQPVALNRVYERSYPGLLLYERWGLYDWHRFSINAQPFIEHYLSLSTSANTIALKGATGVEGRQ